MLSLVSQAWRSWKSAKAVAVLAIIALAVGIGSTTAIFTVVEAVLLKPLPYQHGHRFVSLLGASFSEPEKMSSLTFTDLLEYQQRAHSFDVFGWFKLANFNLTSPGQPQHLSGTEVTASLVNGLGVNPALGRWFGDEAAGPGGAGVAVISNALWQRLGAAPGILGKSLVLNGRGYVVTGVMPDWFRLPIAAPGGETLPSDIWIPLDPQGRGQNSFEGAYFCYARLKPGVTFTQAEADVKRVAAEIARQDPASHPAYTARLDDLRQIITKAIRPTLLLLFGAAGLLLLITCANVAGLLVSRSVARARETAVRVALGAGRKQLALQYFFEALLVSLPGAAIGVFVSFALVRIIVSLAAQYIPRADEIQADSKVLLFALGIGFLATALASLAPLWQTLRTQPNEVLGEGVRASAGVRSRRLSHSLVVAEIALAFTLLAVSAVLIGQLRGLMDTSPGFNPDHLLTFQLTLPDAASLGQQKRTVYQQGLVQALEAIPAVKGAAFVNQLPLAGCCFTTTIYPQGRPVNLNVVQRVSFLTVSSGYFGAMGIPLRSGRFLNDRDRSEELIAVVVNQAAADEYWPGQDPVGSYGRLSSPNGTRFQVVGVVGNVRNDGLASATVPEVYLPSAITIVNPMRFVVRSPLPVQTLAPEIRRAIQSVDPALPIHDVSTMNEIVQESMALQRAGSFMMSFFAFAALLMATLGVYGVVSYSVRQRTVELGTRLALGAIGRDLLYLVVGRGLKMAAYGIAIGSFALIGAAWVLSRAFKIPDFELVPYLYSVGIVAAVGAVASLFPAWRATLLSPMAAIRNDPGSTWQQARQSVRQALQGMSRAVAHSHDALASANGALLAEFVDASRRAASFREALQIALGKLCARFRAESAMLLENVSGQDYICTAATRDQGGCSLPAHGFLLSRFRSYSSPLPFSSGDFDAWLRWAAENKPEHIPELENLRKTGARLAVPLRTAKEILGVLLLGPPVDRGEYSQAEKLALRSCADQFALMIENARLTDRVVEQERLRRDLALAAEVQKRLLPEHSPESGIAALSAFSLPARSVGGDYYGFLDVGDHRIGVALADIAGKGIAAALIMSVVQASLRVLSDEGGISLPQLAAKMNRFLYRSTGSSSYATFFYAQLDDKNRQLHYVNAGHNPPYLLRSTAEIEELSTGGMAIGLFPQARYEEATVDLRSGDVLMIFTDGVTEALNPSDEEFGEERLKNLLRQVVHLPAGEMSARISHELRTWIDNAAQYDDLTFVVMKVN